MVTQRVMKMSVVSKKNLTGKWKYVLNLAHIAMEKCIKTVPPKTLEYLIAAVIQTFLLFAVEGQEEENKPATFPVTSQKGKEGLGVRAS